MTTPVFATVDHRRPLRGVVVGAGALGPLWAKELLANPDTEIAGWFDIDTRRARRQAEALGRPELPTGPSLAALLAAEAPDFVLNVTAPLAHHEVTVTALEHGIAVLSEKPLATTMTEARDMVAAADRAGRLFMVSQNRRYLPTLVAFRETVSRLGGLGNLSCDFYKGHRVADGHFLSTLEQPLLQDMAIHLFDAARAVTGADPVSVYCESYNPPWSWYPGPAAAHAVFELTGGVRFTLDGSWCGDGFPTSWTGTWRAVGAYGSATWDGDHAPLVDPGPGVHLDPVKVRLTTRPEPGLPGQAGALAEFVTALRTGAVPQGECHDNLLSLAMCHAAVESARTGTRVPVIG